MIIDLVDKIKAFIRKMENWRRKVGMENFAMLKTVSEIVEECDAATQNLITQHLEALEGEFKRYLTRFPKPNFSASKGPLHCSSDMHS